MEDIVNEALKYTGYVTRVGATQTLGTKGFKKREIVLDERNEKYARPAKFVFTKDDCALLDNIKTNDIVQVTFYLDGREWTSPTGEKKEFVDLHGYKIAKVRFGNIYEDDEPKAKDDNDIKAEDLVSPDEELPF